MILGLLIGFTVGVLFSIACSGFTRSLHLYWHFKAEGRLANLDEAERLADEGAKVFLIRNQRLFRTIILPKREQDPDNMSPQEICSKGVLLNKICGAGKFWQKRFPGIQVEQLSLIHFD
jgi:hypothetical protein